MFFSIVPPASLAFAALFAGAQATYLHNELSFGHNGKISPNLRSVPGFHLLGNPQPPSLLSNKIILTPPTPGHQRGAIWADKPLLNHWWTVDVDFRVTGPERGSGNLQIWYALNGEKQAGTASIYTIGKFEGLVLVVDQYSASAGFVRGFLNNGNTDFGSIRTIDGLAFGHCEFAYRNLGRPARIAIQQSAEDFRVSVDGRLCFGSNKIKLPLGYTFGISAASADNPDSIEVFKFVTTTESPTPDVKDLYPASQQRISDDGHAQSQSQNPFHQDPGRIPAFQDLPDVSPSEFRSQDAQFADLHNRLQSMMKHIGALNRDVNHYQSNGKSQVDRLIEKISRIEAALANFEYIGRMDKKLDDIKADVRQMKSDFHTSLDDHASGLKVMVRDNHHSLLGTVVSSTPGIAMYIFVVVGSQVLLVMAYLAYKTRKANMPKKYL